MSDKKDSSKPIDPKVREYMSQLGKKAAAVNKAKGSEYFRWLRAQRTKKEQDKKNDESSPENKRGSKELER